MVQAQVAAPGLSAGDIDDATLVARVVAGDAAAFAELYDRHHAPLFRTVLAMTRRRGVAEELLQETFLRAYRHVGQVRLSAGRSLRPWLHRIAIRLVYDWSARRAARSGREAASQEPMAPSSPERVAERSERSQAVSTAIDALPFKQRVVIVLYYLHDMELAEIAATLGLPPGTVKSRLYYARARLRRSLEGDVRRPVGRMVEEVIG